ncbi:MAG: hypothetical protein ACR2OB_11705 [Solirubrobacteraceae bacterium]
MPGRRADRNSDAERDEDSLGFDAGTHGALKDVRESVNLRESMSGQRVCSRGV